MAWKDVIIKDKMSVFYSTEAPPIIFRPKKNSELDYHFSRLIK